MVPPAAPLPDMFDAEARGLHHNALRQANQRAVLTVIGFNPGVSNAEIARLSGLAPQTVSAILADIDRLGLITRGQALRGRRGQPATPIFLRADAAFSIGVEIGWRHLSVLLLDLHGAVLGQLRRTHPYPDARTLIGAVVEMTETLMRPLPWEDRDRLRDMGVCLPANLVADLDFVQAPVEQQALWPALDLVGQLRQRTGLAVTLFNDGNAACWAELIASRKPRPSSFIYFLMAYRMAAGIVGEGSLWEGPSGNSANLGSMLVAVGQDALQPAQAVASLSCLVSRLGEAGIVADDVMANHGDWAGLQPVLDTWLADAAQVLARVVFNTTAVIESRLVVIDGVMPRHVVERLVSLTQVALAELPVASFGIPEVAAGHVGELAPAIGAAELPLYRRYFSRALVNAAG